MDYKVKTLRNSEDTANELQYIKMAIDFVTEKMEEFEMENIVEDIRYLFYPELRDLCPCLLCQLRRLIIFLA